jgi:hypothetical protein
MRNLAGFGRKLLKTYCAGRFRSCGARFTLGKGALLETNSTRPLRFQEVPGIQSPALVRVLGQKRLRILVFAWIAKMKNGSQLRAVFFWHMVLPSKIIQLCW